MKKIGRKLVDSQSMVISFAGWDDGGAHGLGGGWAEDCRRGCIASAWNNLAAKDCGERFVGSIRKTGEIECCDEKVLSMLLKNGEEL